MNSFVQLEGSAFASRSGSSFEAHLVAVCSQEDSLIHAGSGSLGRAVSCASLCFFYLFSCPCGLCGTLWIDVRRVGVQQTGLRCSGSDIVIY